MNSAVMENRKFGLSKWDWGMAILVGGATSLLLCLEAGVPLAAVLGEALVYLAFMLGLAYSFGRSRWQKASGRPKAGRWAFRILFLAMAGGVFVAAFIKLAGQGAAQAGTEQLLQTSSELRAVIAADAGHEEIRREFQRVAAAQTAAAASAPAIHQPFRVIAAELAIDTLRPQLETLKSSSELIALDVLAPSTIADKAQRTAVMTNAKSLLASTEAVRTAVVSIENRAEEALRAHATGEGARRAFMRPIRQIREQAEATPVDRRLENWATTVIALYAYLEEHVDDWTVDDEGVLRADDSKRDEINRLLEEVERAWNRLA